jgi:hypothetical protein
MFSSFFAGSSGAVLAASPGFFSSLEAFSSSWSLVFQDVSHADRDAAVGGIERILGLAQALVGKAANLSDLIVGFQRLALVPGG